MHYLPLLTHKREKLGGWGGASKYIVMCTIHSQWWWHHCCIVSRMVPLERQSSDSDAIETIKTNSPKAHQHRCRYIQMCWWKHFKYACTLSRTYTHVIKYKGDWWAAFEHTDNLILVISGPFSSFANVVLIHAQLIVSNSWKSVFSGNIQCFCCMYSMLLTVNSKDICVFRTSEKKQ